MIQIKIHLISFGMEQLSWQWLKSYLINHTCFQSEFSYLTENLECTVRTIPDSTWAAVIRCFHCLTFVGAEIHVRLYPTVSTEYNKCIYSKKNQQSRCQWTKSPGWTTHRVTECTVICLVAPVQEKYDFMMPMVKQCDQRLWEDDNQSVRR